jgi:hypothetical protein
VGLLNFVSKFDGKLPVDGADAHFGTHFHINSPSTHAPADAIVVPDAHLLFGGDFKRSGVDLVLTNDDRELVLHDYFKGEKHAPLASPDGAYLTGDIVNALTGHVEYAQADGNTAAAVVVGHVTKLTGTATAVRNGVSIILNQGDNVDKGDVLQSGSDSTLGVTFVDGTVFGLSSNARMVVNEMVYDPNGSNNSSLLSLVQGTISFVAGETAKHGDMKVDTPVATMGIRGTAVLVEIDFAVPGQGGIPDAKFQVLVEPDGHTGSYILYDKTTLAPIATVNQAGHQVSIGQGGVSYTSNGLSPELQKLITDVFTLKFTDNTNPNTKTFDHFTDTVIPLVFTPFKLAGGVTVTPIFQLTNAPGAPPPSTPGPGSNSVVHIDGPPKVTAQAGALVERVGVTGDTAIDTVSAKITFKDVNAGDRPTVSATFNSFSYENAQHQDVTAGLTTKQLADIAAVAVKLAVVQDPGNNNNGSATWTYSVPDSAFDFIAAGETLTLTYMARVDNNYAPNDEAGFQSFSITITRGSNDVPVIVTGPPTVAFAAGITTPGGDLTSGGATSGTLSFTDVDLTDTHTLTAALTSAVLSGSTGPAVPPGPLAIFETALTASISADSTEIGSGTVSWKLADLPVYLADFIPEGQTVTLTYTLTLTDSQGATTTQNVVVTITGTDAASVVWIATATPGSPPGGLWSDPSNWETGTVPTANDDAIIITNQLIGLTPSYPVTIDAPAVAKSLTMNDFGTSAPELINQSTLTIGDTFTMSADSIVENHGVISVVGGLMEVLDHSVLQNFGSLELGQGGDFKDQSSISNASTGTIEISGGTLNVLVDITNSGQITVDSNGTLSLGAATIAGGTVTNDGTIDLTGSAVLKDGKLGNSDHIDVSGTGNALNNEKVTNTGTIEILPLGTLTLDQLTTVANAGGTIAIDGTGTLTLQGGVTIVAGALTNSGTVEIEGSSGATFDGVTITGSGTIQVDAATSLTTTPLVLEHGTKITGGKLEVGLAGAVAVKTAGGATLNNVSITNDNSIEVFAASLLALAAGTTVANKATITIDSTGVLSLNDASITGGTIADQGTIHVTGNSAVDGANVTGGQISVDAGQALTLDNVTVNYTIFNDTATGAIIRIDGGDALTLYDVTITGGIINDYSTVSGNIVSGNIEITGSSKISDASLNHGDVTVESGQTLTLDDVKATGTTFAGVAIDSVIHVDGGDKLTLDHATINGGTINDYSTVSGNIVSGNIEITGSSKISGASLNHGNLTIAGDQTLTLDNATVNYTIFDDTAAGAIIQVDGGDTLAFYDVTITGGIINDYSTVSGNIVSGDINITGSSKISDASLNHGDVTIEGGQTLTLDDVKVTGTTFTGVASNSVIHVDGGDKLTLDHATINGGTINDYSTVSGNIVSGDIDITGSSKISNASLNHGDVTIESSRTLTLDNVSVTGTTFNDAATDSVIQVDPNDTLMLSGVTVNGGTVAIGAHALVQVAGGSITHADANVVNDGTIEVLDGSTLKLTGSLSGNGSVQIDGGALFELNGPDTQNVVFDGGKGELQIDSSSFGGKIAGLAATDQLDLQAIGYGLGTTATYVSNADNSGGILTVTDGSHSISLNLVGDYRDAHFAGSSDGNGGTLITMNADDDKPAFAPAEKAQIATVTELFNTTGWSALDSSSPAGGTIHFTDVDLTDRPTAKIIAQSVTLTSAGHSDLSLTPAELSALEHALVLTEAGNANNGTIGWTYSIADSSLDFLGVGQTAIVTSTITLDDHHGDKDTATVKITIDGANDVPKIVAETNPSTQTVILAKSPIVLSAGVTTNSLGLHTESFDGRSAGSASNNGFGHGTFTDSTLDAKFTSSGDAGVVHGSSSVTAAPFFGPLPGHADDTNYLSIGAHGSETITFASEQNAFGLYWGSVDSFNTLDFYNGTQLVASYTGAEIVPLLSNGGQGSFASNGYVEFSDLAPFNKVVLATGGSNAFEIDNISAGNVSDSHIHLASPITGTLTVSDADIGDTLTASVTGNAVAEYNGSTTLPSNINVAALIDSHAITFNSLTSNGGSEVLDWTYNPTNANFDFLEPGDKLTLTFDAQVSDGHVVTGDQPLTVTIVGNGASVVSGTAQNDTFVNVGGGVTIFGKGGQDTFVFNEKFNNATIGDFDVTKDTIDIDHTLFANVAAILASAQPANSGHDTVITDAAHDKLTLTGVTVAQLQLHSNDFHLV